jgi:hypothetical protein
MGKMIVIAFGRDVKFNSKKHFYGETCPKCGAQERYKRRKECVTCRIVEHRKWRKNNTGYGVEWYKNNPGYNRQYKKDNAGSLKKYSNSYRKDSPIKSSAHRKITNSIMRNGFPSARSFSCLICDESAMGYHHYLGYELKYQLDVIPLCNKCHRIVDNYKKEVGSGWVE